MTTIEQASEERNEMKCKVSNNDDNGGKKGEKARKNVGSEGRRGQWKEMKRFPENFQKRLEGS